MSSGKVEVDGFMETPHNAAIITLQKSIGTPQSGDFKIHDLIGDLWALIEKYDIDDLTQIRDILILEEMKDGPIEDEPRTLEALHLWARKLYGDPRVRFDKIHKEVTERFMKLASPKDVHPNIRDLFLSAKSQYDDPTLNFRTLHASVCQRFMHIMEESS